MRISKKISLFPKNIMLFKKGSSKFCVLLYIFMRMCIFKKVNIGNL